MAKTTTNAEEAFFDRVRSAPFIFTGQVVRTEASSVREIAPGPGLALVQVREVFRAPPTLGDIKGKRLTVRLDPKRDIKRGSAALFYATSWIYSDGIAVVEVGREAVPRDSRAMLERVVRAEVQAEDAKLTTRLRDAAMVVTGAVERVSPIEADRTAMTSEHDPVWWRAELMLDRTEKGQAKEPRLSIAFPASLDEYWIETPKLQVGQRGVFILHSEAEGERARMRPPAPAILDALDFQPMAHADRVRALLKLVLQRG